MSILVSESGRFYRHKSSVADRMAAGKDGTEYLKRGKRRTEVSIPINGDTEGPSVLLSLENSPGSEPIRFRHHGTIFPRP